MGQIAAAGINAAGNTAAAGIAAAAQAKTNASNELIAERLNKAQQDLWHEQQQYDFDMWNRNNLYNSPEEQVKRLKEAGINPLQLDGGSVAGNSDQSAGGQTPPQLQAPHLQPNWNGDLLSKAFDIQSITQAFKNMADARKTDSDTTLQGFEVDAMRDAALRGENPHMYKAKILAAEYDKILKENKWINPVMEANLKKIGSETRVNDEFIKYRKAQVKEIMANVKLANLQHDFNASAFPEQLRLLSEQIKSEVQRRTNETNLASAQVNAANASAQASEASADLISQQKNTEVVNTNIAKSKAYEEAFKAGLRRLGINPDAKNLPFYAGIAMKLTDGSLTDDKVVEFFQNLSYAERVGYKQLINGRADLTKFELWNSPSGMFGTGVSMQKQFSDWLNR